VWGSNEFGQLGIGESDFFASSPVNLQLPPAIRVQCGYSNTVVVTSMVFQQGCDAILEEGEVFSWGLNEKGRNGNGKTKDTTYFPERVSLLKGKKVVNAWSMYESTIVLCDGKLFFFCYF
jgi:alpha-tubulin suppressor-like RCC1 family protein